jgi:hypothetical protein
MDGGMDWNRDMMEGMHNRPIELTSYAASIRAILDEDRGTTISIPVAKFADLPYYNGRTGDCGRLAIMGATHGRAPMMPEKSRTFLKESGYGDEWRKLVTWHEPRKYNVWRAKPNPRICGHENDCGTGAIQGSRLRG